MRRAQRRAASTTCVGCSQRSDTGASPPDPAPLSLLRQGCQRLAGQTLAAAAAVFVLTAPLPAVAIEVQYIYESACADHSTDLLLACTIFS